MRTNENNQSSTTQPQQSEKPRNSGYQANSGHDYDPFEGLGVTTLSGSVDAEGFAAFSEEMVRLAGRPDVRGTLDIRVISVSNQQLSLPVLALCATSPTGEIVVYNLLIEGMMSRPLEPFVRQIPDAGGPREVIVDMPTSRAFDRTLQETVARQVAQQYDRSDVADVVHIGSCVVPRDAQLTSPEVTQVFFDSAHLALVDYVGGNGISRVSTKNLTHPQVVVRQRTQVTPGECRLNRIGLPIAADFNTALKLALIQSQQKQDPYQVHTGTVEHNLAEVSGYIDFNIKRKEQQNPYGQYPGMPQQPVAGYMPVVVLTEVAGLANSGKSIEDLRTQLLGLVATLPMTANHGWVRVFEQFPGQKSEKTSIGALGIEHDPFGRGPEVLGKIKVESVSFGKLPEEGKETPIGVAMKWCTQHVAVAMDVEQGGRLEWCQGVFVAAAANKAGANQSIIDECNALTGGRFGALWAQANGNNASAPVVRPETVAVHLGTFTGANGKPRDIRTVDYLTLLASSPKDLQYVAVATAATLPGLSNEVTLSDRRRALTKITNGDVKFTGMATRVYFAPNFIACLIQALVEVGVKISSDDLMNYDQGMQRGGVDDSYGAVYAPGNLYQPTYGHQGPVGEPVGGTYYNPGYLRR